jgi:general stress protein 26
MQSNHSLLKVFYLSLYLCLCGLIVNVDAQEKVRVVERDSVINAAREIISHLKYCALVTVDSTGTANVRTMNPFPPESDMCVWMATNSHTRKYEEIKKNPKVTLYYANHGAAEGYVTITGRAVLVDDMAEKQKRKRDYWDQAFPDWKYLILIKVIPEKMEVVNYKRKMFNDTITWKVPAVEFKK